MKRVEGYKNLYRNDSGAIVNKDSSSLRAYKNKKHAADLKEKEIKELKNEINELKDMLKQILDK